jgi:hypothetical protein
MGHRRIRPGRTARAVAVLILVGVATATARLAASAEAVSPSPSVSPVATSAGPTIAVPGSIDSTGATDASAALISFVEAVPDGSTIEFPRGGMYRMDVGLKFSDRHDLTFEGNGATLRSNGDAHETSSLFALWGGNTGITIRDFNLVGNSSTPGVYKPSSEGAHGILVDGGSDVDVSAVTVSAVWGDGFYVGSWADRVSFHDSTVESNGRNGVSIIAGRNVTVQHVTFGRSGYCTFDIESNTAAEGAANISFLDNTVGRWGNIFLAANGAADSVVDGVTVRGNKVTGGSLQSDVTLARRQNVVFTDNTSTVPADGPVLRFAHVDGLTVTGNVQPLTSGSLASITDSTAVTYDGTFSAEKPSLRAVAFLPILAGAVIVGAVIALVLVRRHRRAPSP